MRKMGFNEGWINLIMVCVSTVTYSVLVNGEPSGSIHPTRGIRQGDPLSPFMLLLCIEGLNGMIKKAERDGGIQGFSLCRRGPKLTHLLFADDYLLFCRATMDECEKLLDIFNDYEEASGKKLNKTKIAIFFSKATDAAMKNNIKRSLGSSGNYAIREIFGCTFICWEREKSKLQLYQGKGVEKNPRMGRKATFTSK